MRQTIWTTLREMTADHGTTVIITTHYMEEAALADKIGFLRKGRLLAEGTPKAMMAENAASTWP